MRGTLLTIVGIAGIETSTSQIGRVHGDAETIARRVTIGHDWLWLVRALNDESRIVITNII